MCRILFRSISSILFFTIAHLLLAGSLFAAEEKPLLFVSIVPQKYFVEQLAGGFVAVEVMVLPGASPATYEPKPSQMEKLSTAAAYFSIGVSFESAWLPRLRAANPRLTIIATDKGVPKRAMGADHHHEDGSGQHENHGEILDPHIWLDPALVAMQAENIAAALGKILPEKKKKIDENLAKFQKNLSELDSELREILSPDKGAERSRKFMVFHPSWGYFAERYALEQIAAESSGKSPSPAQLAKLIKTAKKEGITTIFVQPQFSKKSASVLAKAIGGVVDTANPLSEDWPNNLRSVAKKIAGKK